MRAFWYKKAGSASDVINYGELPEPAPRTGEVRIKLSVSAINPTDCKRRELGRELGKFNLIVPNNDGAGVIDAIGDGVDSKRIGQRVWLFGAQANRPFGTAAEYCVVPNSYAINLPDTESFYNGACLGVPAVTAHRALFADGNIDGLTILITGGAGRVGRYAVQMAKNAGAKVISTAGSKEKCLHIKNLGADFVFNYQTNDIQSEVSEITQGKGVDRMVDVAFDTNVGIAHNLIKVNGCLTAYNMIGAHYPKFPFLEFMYKNISIKPFSIYTMPEKDKSAAFIYIDQMLRTGSLVHLIEKKFPFNEMISAHESIESKKIFGCCLVNI